MVFSRPHEHNKTVLRVVVNYTKFHLGILMTLLTAGYSDWLSTCSTYKTIDSPFCTLLRISRFTGQFKSNAKLR